jgi:cob(I)alamin adenosyltransferase
MGEKYSFDLVTTKKGDGGASTDFEGRALRKDDALFSALGDADELNSQLGLLKHSLGGAAGPVGRREIEAIQGDLIRMSSLVAADPASERFHALAPMTGADVERLEAGQKALLEAGLTIEPKFVLPGKTPGSARADVARTVCRRAERALVRFAAERGRNDLAQALAYLNRLSDYLFILARWMER